MAVEKDFELLDDYLSNRLNGEEKSAFEKKLETDPELKQEIKFQQELTEGIRKARTAELKSILNNIPIAPVQGGQTSMLIKAGSWVAITGIIATGIYFYISGNNETEVSETAKETPAVVEQPEVKNTTPVEPSPTETTTPEKETEKPAEKAAERKTVEKNNVASTPSSEPKKPGLKVYDPSKEESTDKEVEKYEREQLEIISKAFVTSSIEVETDNTSKKFTFHYVFKDGKLVLFGGFEKNLYEILEFISDDKRTVVLFYKANYYLLDINKTAPTLLTPIKDKKLLKKLHEYRGK